MKRKWIICIAVLIIMAITFAIGSMKNKYELGDNYYYLSRYEATDVGIPEGAVIYKSFHKNVIHDVKISNEVTDVNYDDDFIIATQQTEDDTNNSDRSIIKYFIIAKKTDNVHGPFSKKMYIQKRKELGVPNNLQF